MQGKRGGIPRKREQRDLATKHTKPKTGKEPNMAKKPNWKYCTDARANSPKYEPPMSYREAAAALGISVATLKYHVAKGRIRRAMIPGSSKAVGVIAADVRAILSPAATTNGGES